MKRWNGWGDEKNNLDFQLSKAGQEFVEGRIGKAVPLKDATLDQVIAKVPASRMPASELIKSGLISIDAETRVRHSRGQSIPDWLAMRSGEFGVFPDAVAQPETTEQVETLINYAYQNDIVVIPYGGGTSVVGHINPEEGDKPVLTISLGKMNKLMHFDKTSQIATFGAGALGPDVERQLKEHGYTLGHYPQSWELSSIGGWVASRSSGQQSLRYGRIEKMFAGGTIVTPQGLMDIPTFPATSAGPDVRELFLGSEGRIGIITEVKVRVMPVAEKEAFYVAFFPSWEQGVAATRSIVQNNIQLSMMRLSNGIETKTHMTLGSPPAIKKVLDKYLGLRGIGDNKVMFTFGTTGSKEQCRSALKLANKEIKKFSGVNTGSLLGKRWEHSRFRAPYLRHGLWEIGAAADSMETCVDWADVSKTMTDMENEIRDAIKDEGEVPHPFTHLSHFYGQGCSVYTTFMFRTADNYDDTLKRWQKLKAAGANAIVANGGTISHQHGVGKDHAPYLEAEKGELGIKALKGLYDTFDPESLMNPGKQV
ncbi:FAD-binding oxidoreductase [Bacterioplanoides sp.]|uniref:FAD-binding oxidoreductase n=1 Tax=Bacterioplanoides sp. TaxID=2066072 RepID=UPI003B591495